MSQARWVQISGATLWGGNGGINQSKEAESCVEIITWIGESFQLYQVPLPSFVTAKLPRPKYRTQLFEKWIILSTGYIFIQWINAILVFLILIHLMVIYPVHSALQCLKNQDQRNKVSFCNECHCDFHNCRSGLTKMDINRKEPSVDPDSRGKT